MTADGGCTIRCQPLIAIPARAADVQAAAAPPAYAAGSGSLCVTRVGTRSLVTRAFATSPLRLLTPRNHGPAAWIYTSTYGGGLVDGDAIALDVEIGARASALLATQAATKAYRSARGTSVAMNATVGADGLLIVAPDPVVCFAGACYRQEQRIDLDRTSGLVLVDWLTSGRHASGERWSFTRYCSRVTIWRDGARVLVDALDLEGRSPDELRSRMSRFDVVLLAVVTGPMLAAHATELLSRVARMPVRRRAAAIVGASEIPGGCIMKMAGTSVEDVGRAAREYLQFVPDLLGDDPWARKW
jgi:urease accessory protein